jgi:cell filamentation protein
MPAAVQLTIAALKLGITDADVLHDAEYRLAAVRRTQIVRGLAPIAETYDAEHLKALHGWLFQDVYEWAGHVRDVPISKMTDFARSTASTAACRTPRA